MKKILIVGSGPFGATSARVLSEAGYEVTVIEKRNHIGGNCFTEEVEGVHVHTYGPHIFHTNDCSVWEWVNKYAKFNNYRHQVVANYEGETYALPFNMFTFSKLWKITSPLEAKEIIRSQSSRIGTPKNLEEHAIKMIGLDIYEKFVKGYTQKQWGRDPKDLPTFIIKRLPVRYTYDNDYFEDKYQGIPIGGYTKMFENILEGIEVRLNTDFYENRDFYERSYDLIIYTGPIDKFFEYKHGKLEYRSLVFDTQKLEIENFQGCAQMNYTSIKNKFTRIVEHKHFDDQGQKNTVITKEYSIEYDGSNEPFYPINNEKNNQAYSLYKKEADSLEKYVFGGRLATFKYYDMHQVIASALSFCKKFIEKDQIS